MAETGNLGLPLLAPSQAQKHVTVNEALARLDGLTQMRLMSVATVAPPAPVDGAAWAVPVGATGDWAGQDGRIAIGSNGGWVFADPAEGWRGWIVDEAREVRHDGAGWAGVPGPAIRSVTFDHAVAAGAGSVTTEVIPQNAIVFAVTGRVASALTGTLTSWTLGVAGAEDRYGSGIGLAQGSWLVGVTGQPVTYYADTPLVLTATGGDFAAGTVRLVLHYFKPEPPEI
ncbi:MAG: DUF2793 domain-containing protein [Paracoccaceae bacterium]